MKDEQEFRESCERIAREPALNQLRTRMTQAAHHKLRKAASPNELWQAQAYAWAADTFFEDIKRGCKPPLPKNKIGPGA